MQPRNRGRDQLHRRRTKKPENHDVATCRVGSIILPPHTLSFAMRYILCLAVLLALPATLCAQEPIIGLENDTRIRVSTIDAQTVVGAVAESNGLVLIVQPRRGDAVPLSYREISALDFSVGRSRWQSTVAGMGYGVLFGSMIGGVTGYAVLGDIVAEANGEYITQREANLIGAGVGTVAGLVVGPVVGAFAGAVLSRERWHRLPIAIDPTSGEISATFSIQ